MGRSDGGALPLLLIFCSLDAIQRLPGGYIISGVVSCGLLIVGVIWMIFYLAANVDNSAMPPPPLPPGAVYASPPPPSITYLSNTRGEHSPHTPQQSSNDAWWTTFFLVSAFLIVITTPACFYMPNWRRRRVAYIPATTIVQGVPIASEIADRPLLALRTDCLSEDHV